MRSFCNVSDAEFQAIIDKISEVEQPCPICLQDLRNKPDVCFTSSCYHTFCFPCLLKWAEWKAECPLCKQSFLLILHKFDRNDMFDVYNMLTGFNKTYIIPKINKRSRGKQDNTSRDEQGDEANVNLEMFCHYYECDFNYICYLRITPGQITKKVSFFFRRMLYEKKLYAVPHTVQRNFPGDFSLEPNYTQRLLPWLNRELNAIISDKKDNIPIVTDLIMSLILKCKITSLEFITKIQRFTVPYTDHFIHEFNNFAISPYDMLSSDIYTRYEGIISPPMNSFLTDYTGPGNSLSMDLQQAEEYSKELHVAKTGYCVKHKRNCIADDKETVPSSFPSENSTEVTYTMRYEAPGPSTSSDTTKENNNKIALKTLNTKYISSDDEQVSIPTDEITSTEDEHGTRIKLSFKSPISRSDQLKFVRYLAGNLDISYVDNSDDNRIVIAVKSKSNSIEPSIASSRNNTQTEPSSNPQRSTSEMPAVEALPTSEMPAVEALPTSEMPAVEALLTSEMPAVEALPTSEMPAVEALPTSVMPAVEALPRSVMPAVKALPTFYNSHPKDDSLPRRSRKRKGTIFDERSIKNRARGIEASEMHSSDNNLNSEEAVLRFSFEPRGFVGNIDSTHNFSSDEDPPPPPAINRK